MRLVDPGEIVAARRRNYERLAGRLQGRLALPFAALRPGTCPLFLPVLVPDRARVVDDLARQGVQSAAYWSGSHPTCPPDLAAPIGGWRRQCLELPIHQGLTLADVDRVAEAVLRVVLPH
jgi:dTDP-4-amino-4,6-dideoxygalactose transaminase